MGYHADVQTGLVKALSIGVPNIPLLNLLSSDEGEQERLAVWVGIRRDDIDFEPHLPINPDSTDQQQPEVWTWIIDVKGGGGDPRPADRGAEVDLLLEKVRAALGARKLTADCGPIHLRSEEYVGISGAGVVYRQLWWHERM